MSIYKNDYPEPEDDISIEELIEREQLDRDDEIMDAYFLELDDMEELDFNRDPSSGWYEGLGPCSQHGEEEDEQF